MQLNIRHFGYFIVLLKNLDIQKDNEYILSKMVFSFRDKFNSSYYRTKGKKYIYMYIYNMILPCYISKYLIFV